MMSENEQQMEKMRKKLQDLDSEINTFIQVVRELKEMKDSAGLLHDRLLQNAETIESQKKELEKLMSSSGSLIAAIEEQTRGVVLDLEKKSDALLHDVKTGISQMQELKKRPYEIDHKLKKMEERLELSIQENHAGQKRFTWMVLLIFMAAILFIMIAFYQS